MTGLQSLRGGMSRSADRPGGKSAISAVTNARSEPPARRAATTRPRLRDIATEHNKAPSVIFSAHHPQEMPQRHTRSPRSRQGDRCSHQDTTETSEKGSEMTQPQAEVNKAIVRRLYDVFRTGDVAALGEVLAEDFINHNPQTTNGLTGAQALFSQVGSIDAEIHRMVCEGNLVAVHAHYTAPQSNAGMDFFKINNGKIVEHWDVLQDIPDATASGQDMFSELTN
jgi:predicted SnoaL-like aldol condensation-catalyzing enzyme